MLALKPVLRLTILLGNLISTHLYRQNTCWVMLCRVFAAVLPKDAVRSEPAEVFALDNVSLRGMEIDAKEAVRVVMAPPKNSCVNDSDSGCANEGGKAVRTLHSPTYIVVPTTD
jgi:hypothetical protein